MSAMQPYNGWSAVERRATISFQRAALIAGTIAKPHQCSICHFRNPTVRDGWNYVTLHDEDYSTWWRPFEVCRRCHGRIHDRFAYPERWLRHLDRVSHAGWGRRLLLEPSTQFRPFLESYPQGLAGLVSTY